MLGDGPFTDLDPLAQLSELFIEAKTLADAEGDHLLSAMVDQVLFRTAQLLAMRMTDQERCTHPVVRTS